MKAASAISVPSIIVPLRRMEDEDANIVLDQVEDDGCGDQTASVEEENATLAAAEAEKGNMRVPSYSVPHRNSRLSTEESDEIIETGGHWEAQLRRHQQKKVLKLVRNCV